MSEIAIRPKNPNQTMPNRVGLNQYNYYINFSLYLIKNWLEIAEIAIKPRKTNQNEGQPNQTRPKQNKTKSSKTG